VASVDGLAQAVQHVNKSPVTGKGGKIKDEISAHIIGRVYRRQPNRCGTAIQDANESQTLE